MDIKRERASLDRTIMVMAREADHRRQGRIIHLEGMDNSSSNNNSSRDKDKDNLVRDTNVEVKVTEAHKA